MRRFGFIRPVKAVRSLLCVAAFAACGAATAADTVKKWPDTQIAGEDYVPIATLRDFAPYVAKIAASGAHTVINSNWGDHRGKPQRTKISRRLVWKQFHL